MTIENITNQPHGFAWPRVYRAYHNGLVYFAPSIPALIAMALTDARATINH